MFSKINSRLWLTYAILVGLVLFAAFAGIVLAFRNSPLLYWKEFVQLNYVTNSLANRLDFMNQKLWMGIIELFLLDADLGDVRVIIIDGDGQPRMDSGGLAYPPIPDFAKPGDIYQQAEGSIRLFRDEKNQAWFFQINPINKDLYLVSAIQRPVLRIGAILQDELLNPLFKVGIAALAASLILSWFVARWITSPLKKISESAAQLAIGDFPSIDLEGPAEVQQLAAVINTMDQKVRDSLQSQKEFVANVSHEFKTPLTSIQGFAQAILDEAVHTKKDRSHAAEVILQETDRLNFLVNDLLTLARLDAGTMNFEKVEISINPLIKNIFDKIQFQLDEKKLQVEINFNQENIIFADGERIIQVFSNLINNAVKFTPEGGLIRVYDQSDENYAVIYIEDNGIGISDDDLDKVFERFYQADKSRGKDKTRSVGLGLSIAKQIVLSHQGEISVESELGNGSRFMVKLPLAYAKRK